MEHEVFVPVAAGPLRRALADPVRVARAVPGLQQDAGAPPVSGRLKVRVGGSSITYRGTLRVLRQDDGSYTLEGEAAEARGSGTVKVALTLRLTAADGGTTLVFDGGVTGDGRFAELDDSVAATAGRRLLNQFASGVARAGEEPAETEEPAKTEETEVASPGDAAEADDEPSRADAEPSGADDEPSRADAEPSRTGDEATGGGGVAEPSVAGADTGTPVFRVDDEPPAEAAHARRTMIGRSAEEVDHAPPRGRYAPVPAPSTGPTSTALRWAAPAAALALASAIVIGRALRRRRPGAS